MASKLPFKFFDWKQKLTTWSIRINKVIKHKVLSKSRHALVISMQENENELADSFQNKFKASLKKTWQIYELNLTPNQIVPNYKGIQQKFKGRQYDAIVVLPKSNHNLKGFYSIADQQFATNTNVYEGSLLKNILAYRLAHKYLTTSGVLILSNSQSDFGKVQNKNGQLKVHQPALKNVLDAQVSYLGVVVGDRDYTDLNSWSVVGLSQQFVGSEYEEFVIKMYTDWVDGRNLPMPGSFAIFKMKQQGKKNPFVQYL